MSSKIQFETADTTEGLIEHMLPAIEQWSTTDEKKAETEEEENEEGETEEEENEEGETEEEENEEQEEEEKATNEERKEEGGRQKTKEEEQQQKEEYQQKVLVHLLRFYFERKIGLKRPMVYSRQPLRRYTPTVPVKQNVLCRALPSNPSHFLSLLSPLSLSLSPSSLPPPMPKAPGTREKRLSWFVMHAGLRRAFFREGQSVR